MRILTNVSGLGIANGADIAAFQGSRELARRGHDIRVVYTDEGALGDEWRSFAGSVVPVPALDVYGVRHALQSPRRLWPGVVAGRQAHPDVIWDNRYFSLPWARAVGSSIRRPVVGHVHGFPGAPGVSDRILTHLAMSYVAVSDFVRRDLVARSARESRIHVIHQGLDFSDYPPGGSRERQFARAGLDLDDDAYVVLYFGRLSREKGIEVLMAAVRALATPAVLVVVGGADDPTYEATLKRLAPEGTRFLGLLRDVVMPLHSADVVVVPSIWDEPFGRTAVEALATGRPVVASAVGGLPEILAGQLSGFLFPRANVSALSDQLERLRHWHIEQPGLGDACSAYARQHFSMAGSIGKLEALLVAAAEGTPRRASF